MRTHLSKCLRLSTAVGVAALMLSSVSCGVGSRPASATASAAAARPAARIQNTPGVVINLTAKRMSTTLPDGTPAPMWGFCETASCATSSNWAPGPIIYATAGDTVQIALTNALPVPTSLVVLGQLGGGLGTPVKMASPGHAGQNNTTFVGNAPVNPPGTPNAFIPPAQSPRVRSFGTEVAAAGTATLTFGSLKPGTYLYETGTLPSLQVPMGLYGVLVVTAPPSPATPGAAGTAYPGVSYDADATLLFSEIDVAQNAAVDAAAVAGADVNRRFNDPLCTPTAPCYPAAVNYAPTYFLINGHWFDKTAPEDSAFHLANGTSYAIPSSTMLVRLLNAGSRTHIPSIVGLPMALVAEDGNLAKGNPKVQSEVLLTAGKTYDAVVHPAASGNAYAAATYPVFDRSLSLSTNNRADGGMQAFLLINQAAAIAANGGVVGTGAPGFLPAAVVPRAVDDAFKVPYNTAISANVTANDTSITSVALNNVLLVQHGTLSLGGSGSFTYTPTAGYSGPDSFTYYGNGNAALTATVTLTVAAQLTGAGNTPVANADSYTSAFTSTFSVARPGVLSNDSDPHGFPLTASLAATGSCASVTLRADGSFDVTATGAPASCAFTYNAVNSQGTASATPATVTVSFGAPGATSGLAVTVADAISGVAITDYRWTLQEDLTFKHDVTGTPSVSTRTVGTSFHRSHMPVVATGCVGPISCGSGQSTRIDVAGPIDNTTNRKVVTDADALLRQATLAQVALDPSRHYYVSILPGDAGSPPGHIMGGGEVKLVAGSTKTLAPLNIKLQVSPLVTAQMSLYIYEDNNPTNGANDGTIEPPLGGFNIILLDPAGRTGDPAGQQTYDAFNMPLSNALLGRPGCPDELNGKTNGTATSPGGNLVGAIYTCPSDPNYGTPLADGVNYALAGHALIKNLTPARYDVIAHPGAAREAAGEVWWQTETLEGTPAQDAFVGINEPGYFQEFGPPGPHTTIGFVNPAHVAAYATARGLTGTHTITGKITSQHMSHPSSVTLWDSGGYDLLSSTTCQVVLNSQGGNGPAIASAQCDPDGNFVLSGVPAGDFEVEVFDQWLDQIIQAVAVSVPAATATVAMGDIPVLSWFTQYDQNIFMDLNGNGKMDPGEPGISNVPLSVRFRNGAPSMTTLTDSNGNGLLVEMFPLFNWYVAEADTTRFKQTGVHVYVDGGGKVDTAGPGARLWSSNYAYPLDGTTERTELPGSQTYGLQSFISQRNRVEWGRAPYLAGENGGILGTVVYSSTRPFDDMRLNVQTIWEPLIPRVQVNLYQKKTLADGTETLALVDSTTTTSFDDFVNLVKGSDGKNYLLGTDGTLRDPATGAVAPTGVTAGVQVNLQCPGQDPSDPFVLYTLGAADRKRCYDGWHDWNQVQGAPYDGRFSFPSPAYIAANPLAPCTPSATTTCPTLVSLPPGHYVVEEVTPPGYQVVKEEDKNILIGDAFVAPVTQQFGPLGSIFILPDQATLGNANPYNPSTGDPGFQSNPTSNLGVYGISNAATFPECVGTPHRVPDFLSLYPQAKQVAPFAGMDRPLCDRKLVALNDQQQASAAFFVFTEVPVASNNTGIILDDASSEFNAAAPDFGEKASVPFVPVSIKDFTGMEVSRTYSDQWGAYNTMTPSSWLVNPPTPSGYGPNMMVVCINDPGPIPGTNGTMITDPAYNPAYSNFCYTVPFMPGQTTYLDTPVLPIAAFAAGYNPPDCAQPDHAPAILRVDGSAGIGPWLPAAGGTLTIQAQGDQLVPNPAYAGPFAASGPSSQPTVLRHYGFGAAKGTVKLVTTIVNPADGTRRYTTTTLPPASVAWSDTSITVTVQPLAALPSPQLAESELVITTASGLTSVDTVTVTQGGAAPTLVQASLGQTIQGAVDLAKPGDLIMVDAGTYNELVIMSKPVRLQGVGAASVIINAAKYPTSKLETWRKSINQLFNVDSITGNQTLPSQVDPLPTQEITGGVIILEPSVLGTEEGPGITVLAKNLPFTSCNDRLTVGYDSNFICQPSRIDGLSVTGGDAGGGIYVNGWAHGLEISNNRVYGNAGAYNGGIRVGVPYLEQVALPASSAGQRIPGFGYDENVRIHHNAVTKNGTVEAPLGNGGAGGGVSICSGTDGYSVDHNWICGNYSSADGAGIGHLGLSQGGSISANQVLFNQSFQQTAATHGGGIFVGGEPPLVGTVSLGTGDVTIDGNLVRGNFAEAGQGGGIRLQQVNGADVTAFPADPSQWYRVTISNNLIVNNVAGWAGGGVSVSDALRTSIVDDTIASNDSAGIAGVMLAGGVVPVATPGVVGRGRPSPSGIVSEPTSAQLLAQMASLALRTANAVSQPTLTRDIIWQNRSFYYAPATAPAVGGLICAGNDVGTAGSGCTTLANQATTGQCPSGAAYWDIGALGDGSPVPGAVALNPTFTIMTSTVGYLGSGNTSPAGFRLGGQYCNGSRVVPELPGVINPPSVKNLQVAATEDEGNNYVNMRYGPLYSSGSVASGNVAAFGNYLRNDAVSPAALDLATSINTTTSAPVTFSNTGATSLTITNVALAGTNPGQFAIATNGCPVPPATLAAGASCTVTVTFAPVAASPLIKTAVLQFNVAGTGNSASVALTGTILVPNLVFSPNPALFASLLQVTTAPQAIKVTNAGPGIAVINNVAIGGGVGLNPGQFAITSNNCPGTLPANAFCTVAVTFTPAGLPPANPVTKSAFLNFNLAAPGGLQRGTLTGTLLIPAIAMNPTTFGFGAQLRNSTTLQDVALLNSGTGPLTIIGGGGGPGITITGPNAGQFAIATNACPVPPATLAAGASCTIVVSFHPTSAGAKAATLNVRGTTPVVTGTVALTGSSN